MEKRNILPPLRASITTPRGVFPNLVGGGMGMASKTLSCLLITTKVHIKYIPVHTSTHQYIPGQWEDDSWGAVWEPEYDEDSCNLGKYKHYCQDQQWLGSGDSWVPDQVIFLHWIWIRILLVRTDIFYIFIFILSANLYLFIFIHIFLPS